MKHSDAALRKAVRASKDRDIAPTARHLMELSQSFPVQKTYSMLPGIHPADLQKFSSLFAQGIQWIGEQYPEQPGPKFIFFGSQGGTVKIGNIVHPVTNACTLAHPVVGEGDCHIIIPYQFVALNMRRDRMLEKTLYKAKARQSLGEMTAEEVIFAAGVEEAYHAVQQQDPVLRKKYENAEQYLVDSTISPHENTLRELDVVPILKTALEEFRRRRGQGMSAAS